MLFDAFLDDANRRGLLEDSREGRILVWNTFRIPPQLGGAKIVARAEYVLGHRRIVAATVYADERQLRVLPDLVKYLVSLGKTIDIHLGMDVRPERVREMLRRGLLGEERRRYYQFLLDNPHYRLVRPERRLPAYCLRVEHVDEQPIFVGAYFPYWSRKNDKGQSVFAAGKVVPPATMPASRPGSVPEIAGIPVLVECSPHALLAALRRKKEALVCVTLRSRLTLGLPEGEVVCLGFQYCLTGATPVEGEFFFPIKGNKQEVLVRLKRSIFGAAAGPLAATRRGDVPAGTPFKVRWMAGQGRGGLPGFGVRFFLKGCEERPPEAPIIVEEKQRGAEKVKR